MSPRDAKVGVAARNQRPVAVHVTTTDISLELLLGPQLSAFVNRGYRVVGASAPGPRVEGLGKRGILHVPLEHATRAMRPDRDARAFVELYRLFQRLRPAIVHTHNPKPGIYGRLAARAARVPVVVNTVHGLYAQPGDPWAKRVLVYGLERAAAACSDAELVQSREDLALLRRLRVPASRLHLLGNGVDLDRFDPSRFTRSEVTGTRRQVFNAGPDDVVVGLVGRLVLEKGYREVFEAARQLAARWPQVRFVVVGPHDPEKADALTQAELDRAASEAGMQFLGMRDDVDRLYPAMDLYVLASHREGFPRSAMEAAAMGLPIVATDIRGCREVVEHARTGYLVPVRSADALAGAIEELGRAPETREKFGRAGREKAEREFDHRRQIELTLRVYSKLLAQRGLAAPDGPR